MNKIFKLFMSFAVLTLLFSACTPEEEELGAIDVSSDDLVEGRAFTIEHDAENPNIVYLKSLMDSRYKPLWSHPQGRSQEQTVTLQMPFPGVYEVVYGVMTRGGIVYGDTATFEVADMYPGFIEHPMWTMIAGGAGESKTWYLDLDSEGVSRYFLGPMYFFRSWYTWDGLHTPDGDNYIDAEVWNWEEAIEPTVDREGEVRSGAPMPGVAAWYWTADWPGNQWMADAADFGTMTFSLQNSAKVVVDQEEYGLGFQEGTFLLDTENHLIKFTDARPLHDVNRDGDDVDWYNVRILYLNEDAMQLGVVPNGDDAAMTVYNYISEEYRDNWTPGEEEEPEPPYEGDANLDLTTSTTTTKKWVLSINNPYNWTALDGTFLNAWQTPEDYTSTGWAPYDASLIENVSMTLTKSGDNNGEYSFTDGAGDEISGTYTVDDENNIVFDQSISFPISDWVALATTADNKLRLIRAETDPYGNVNGIWLGQRSTEKAEYMVFHFVQGSVGEGPDPEAALKNLISAKTWKLDSEQTYESSKGWGVERGPIIFSDYSSWIYTPLAGEHYGSGEAGVDYGTMKFNLDGTVVVNQRKRIYTYDDGEGGTAIRDGSPQAGDVLETDEVVTLNGTWELDYDAKKITMSVGVLHPWTSDYAVADWGDLTIYETHEDALLLQVMRSQELSGEDAMPMTYVYIPVE